MSKRLPSFTAPVSIDTTGDITQTKWVGTFVIKRVLTHKDRFKIEDYYAEYLRDDSKINQEMVKINASALAELRVRIQSGPTWWEDSDHGLDLVDATPIHALMAAVKEARDNWTKELTSAVAMAPKETVKL